MNPFSLEEISKIPFSPLKDPTFIKTTDGINLAVYPFLPQNPSSIIVFYHGGGFYSGQIYQHIGRQLEKNHNIGSYFVDIRGHGHSNGNRGDAPSKDHVLEDINTMLVEVKSKHPTTPVYLAGHSSGAGLILNYSTYDNKKSGLYDGYILIAPYLGPHVGVLRKNAPQFVKKVRTWVYILNGAFGIPLFQHITAVYFNYDAELLKQDPLIVSSYTYIMSCATTPHDPQHIFEQLDKPCSLYIGADDEQFIPEKVVAFAQFNKKDLITTQIIPHVKHLSILVDAAHLIHKAIE